MDPTFVWPEMKFWWHQLPFSAVETLYLEKVVRTVVVYVFLLFWFRFAGKRELGQMTPFDLVVLLILSNSLQNALIGNDNTLTGGLVGGIVLLYSNKMFSWLAVRVPLLARFFEGTPTVLIEDGKILEDSLRHEKMTHGELERAIRKHDLDPILDLPTIKKALLETDGTVTITRRSPPMVLIENGVILEPRLRHEKMNRAELLNAIRKQGLDPKSDLPSIQKAMLETDGTVTITRKSPPGQG